MSDRLISDCLMDICSLEPDELTVPPIQAGTKGNATDTGTYCTNDPSDTPPDCFDFVPLSPLPILDCLVHSLENSEQTGLFQAPCTVFGQPEQNIDQHLSSEDRAICEHQLPNERAVSQSLSLEVVCTANATQTSPSASDEHREEREHHRVTLSRRRPGPKPNPRIAISYHEHNESRTRRKVSEIKL